MIGIPLIVCEELQMPLNLKSLKFNLQRTHKTNLRGFEPSPPPKQSNDDEKADGMVKNDEPNERPAAERNEEPDVKEDLQSSMQQIEEFIQEQELEDIKEQDNLFGHHAGETEQEDEAIDQLRIKIDMEMFLQQFDNIDCDAEIKKAESKKAQLQNTPSQEEEDSFSLDAFHDNIDNVYATKADGMKKNENQKSTRLSLRRRITVANIISNGDIPRHMRGDVGLDTHLTPLQTNNEIHHISDTPVQPYETYIVFTFIDNHSNGFGPFMDLYRQVVNGVQKHRAFCEMILLKCVEKHVTQPYIYYATFRNNEEVNASNQYFWVDISNEVQLGDKFRRKLGCYKELDSFVVAQKRRSTPLSPLALTPTLRRLYDYTGYIVIACKVLEDSDTHDFECIWKGWTGAEYICHKMPKEFGLTKITLYKRWSEDNIFMYVCTVECSNILNPSHSVRVLQFIEAFRLRISAYTALYKAESIRKASDPETVSNSSTKTVDGAE